MKLHSILCAFFVSALLASVGGRTHAHGGRYNPPPLPEEGPAGGAWNGPGDLVPGSAPSPRGGPSAPGSAAPRQPGAPTSGARPSSPSSPRSAPANASSSPRSSVTSLNDFSLWSWWWEFNKEPFLQVRARVGVSLPQSGSDAYFLGKGQRDLSESSGARPTNEQINTTIVPALLTALAEAESNDVATAALIALARIGEDHGRRDRAELGEAIRPFLASANQEVAETAAAALGILGNDGAAPLLAALLLDTPAGREEVGRTSVSSRTRAFAAYALGLLGGRTENDDVRRFVVYKLVRALDESERAATADIGVACVLALGRVPLAWSHEESTQRESPTTSREAQLRYLLEVLARKKTHRLVRSHIPNAVAWLLTADEERYDGPLREEVVRDLLARFDKRKKEPRELRQACAIAFGVIGDADASGIDGEIFDALSNADGGRPVEHLALLSLGRVASRAGAGEQVSVEDVRRHFLKVLAKRGTEPSRWAALGLAIFERGLTAGGRPTSVDARRALWERLESAGSPSDIGAISIAVGILGDPGGREVLRRKLHATADDSARGFAAIGLGMIGAREAVDEIRTLVDESTYRPRLLREGAIALGLLGDREVVELLSTKLRASRSLAAKAALAQGLGRIGDASAIAPLVEMLSDRSSAPITRAFAAVALGLVADKDALPWNSTLSVDSNYGAAPATLYDSTGLGVLNIL